MSSENFDDFFGIYEQDDSYRGEKFPQKYLTVDGVQPTEADLTYYVERLLRTVDYFNEKPNDTDPNVAIGLYLMKGVLKRTLLDYSDKIENNEIRTIKDIIKKADNFISHFVYQQYKFGPSDLAFQLSRLFIHDDTLVYTIRKFNKHAIIKWIYSNVRVNKFIEAMDDMTLPREEYAELVTSMDEYYAISDSDYCIAGISAHRLPLNNDEITPCAINDYCVERVFRMPSVAYALSHRFIYLLGLQQTRRCYIVSEEADQMHMDIMCANMYRETVYLARRGYFYRDLFLEHIALCALLGYEEFHRVNWFKKSASWIDEDGCVNENRNFEINRTKIYISRATSAKKRRELKKLKRIVMDDECQHHQMALMMAVMAHAIRHAAHFMDVNL